MTPGPGWHLPAASHIWDPSLYPSATIMSLGRKCVLERGGLRNPAVQDQALHYLPPSRLCMRPPPSDSLTRLDHCKVASLARLPEPYLQAQSSGGSAFQKHSSCSRLAGSAGLRSNGRSRFELPKALERRIWAPQSQSRGQAWSHRRNSDAWPGGMGGLGGGQGL